MDHDMSAHPFVPFSMPYRSQDEMRRRGREFLETMNERRSVRHFSSQPVSRELIELAVATASTAPSGAHRQPWKFVAIGDPQIKREIRIAAEAEERQTYEGGRMPDEWREALEPIGTDWRKPYLETVPWIVVVFEELYGIDEDGGKRKNYYVKESVGIACGILIAALQYLGLAALTHTPSPMGFLSEILERPENERPFVLIPVGYPAEDAVVPDFERKAIDDVLVWKCDSTGNALS